MAAPPTVPTTNPYQIGSLIFALTTPPERTFKLAPRWKGPYRVCRISNEYQVVYEDGKVERTIHVNHANPAKFTAPNLPEPVPPVEEPRQPLGYLPAGFTHKPSKPRDPPVNRNEAAMPPPAIPAVPAAPLPAAAPARRHSTRLNPELGHAHAIKSKPPARQPHSAPKSRTANSPEMARTCPLTVSYNDSMRSKENCLSFASLCLVDLRNRPKPVPECIEATPGRPPQNAGSRLLLPAERPHRPPWTPQPSPLHESCPVVFAAI